MTRIKILYLYDTTDVNSVNLNASSHRSDEEGINLLISLSSDDNVAALKLYSLSHLKRHYQGRYGASVDAALSFMR